jgi:predicted nucleotide-binding protein (sugar kinase/HSP70/actin superfamily)
MKLKEARNLAIKYCEENKCNYTYISHNNVEEFYLTDKEDKHTVFFVNRNGSLKPCRTTEYAAEFHKELKRRKKNRRKNGKRVVADIVNRDEDED